MMDAEIREAFDSLNAAIDRLFELHGLMSPRQAALRPLHLRDAGDDTCEAIGGLMMVKHKP
jgi:hypothetical protein